MEYPLPFYDPPAVEVSTPEPTNRYQKRIAARKVCWYWHTPEWWQRGAQNTKPR